jgi:hypothetical protein
MHREDGSRVARCSRCEAEQVMLTPAAASRMAGISTREIYRRVESGHLHFVEGDAGQLLVCSQSLREENE